MHENMIMKLKQFSRTYSVTNRMGATIRTEFSATRP